MWEEANNLYFNGRYIDAYNKYVEAYKGLDRLDLRSRRVLEIKFLRCLIKYIKTGDREHKDWAQDYLPKIINRIFEISKIFPSEIEDQLAIYQTSESGVVKFFFNQFGNWGQNSLGNIRSIISMLNYQAYLTKQGESYNLYIGTKSIAKSLFEFSNLLGLSLKHAELLSDQLFKYGLYGQLVQVTNKWKDTLAHSSIHWGKTAKGLAFLKYLDHYPSSYVETALLFGNHQRENLLQDVVNSNDSSLIKWCSEILRDKKLLHLLEKKHGVYNYLYLAAQQEQDEFIAELLTQIEGSATPIRINLNRQYKASGEDGPSSLAHLYADKPSIFDHFRKAGGLEMPVEEDDELKKFTEDPQNAHRGLSTAIKKVIEKLRTIYGEDPNWIERQCQNCEQFFHHPEFPAALAARYNVEEELKWHLKGSEGEIESRLKGIEVSLSRIISYKEFSYYYGKDLVKFLSNKNKFPQDDLKNEASTLLKQALAYVWAALSDPYALDPSKNKELSKEEILDRQLSLFKFLYKAYAEGIEQGESQKEEQDDVEMIDVSEIVESSSSQGSSTQNQEELPIGVSREEAGTTFICLTGLLERIIWPINGMYIYCEANGKQETLFVEKEGIPQEADKARLEENKIIYLSIMKNFKGIESCIAVNIDLLTLARINNNFDLYQANDLRAVFIPTQQFFIAKVKQVFSERFETHMFGNTRTRTDEKDFLILEQVLRSSSFKLPSKVGIVLEYFKAPVESWDPILYADLLKIILCQAEFSTGIISTLAKIQLIDNVKASVGNITKFKDGHHLYRTSLVLHLNNPEHYNGTAEEILKISHTKELIERLLGQLDILNKQFFAMPNIAQITKQEASKLVKTLAQNKGWDPFDIVKFYLIALEQGDERIVESLKWAVVEDNYDMVSIACNLAETINERQVIKKGKGVITYTNEFFKQISDSLFGKGRTILHLAAQYSKDGRILKELLEYDEFREIIDKQNSDLQTPVFTAVYHRNSDAIKIFCEYGADLNKPDNSEMSPLLMAASQGDINTMNNLLDHGANPFATNNAHQTFVHLAAMELAESKEIGSGEEFRRVIKNKILDVPGAMFSYSEYFVNECFESSLLGGQEEVESCQQ